MHFFVNVKRLMVTTWKFVNIEGWLLTDRFVTKNCNFRQYLNLGKFLIGPKKAYVALHVGPIWLLTTWVRRRWRGYLSCGTGMVLTGGTHKILWQAGPTIFWPVGSTKFWQVGPGCCRHMGPNNADWWDPQILTSGTRSWCHVVSFNSDVVTFSVTFWIWQNLRAFELFAKFWKQKNWRNIKKIDNKYHT